jgi:predicted PurR-regulated permease PerM
MALPVRDQLKYWGIAAAVFFVLLWLLSDVVLPFVLGAAIAYLLDPIADWLQRRACRARSPPSSSRSSPSSRSSSSSSS